MPIPVNRWMAFDFGQGKSGATMSLDRIDNEKGYTLGNVVFCRVDTNSKKNNRPVDEFMEQLDLEFSETDSTAAEGREQKVNA